jgi:hypothetical protein
MAAAKKRRGMRSPSLAAVIPDLLVSALGREDDVIITCETNPDTGHKTLHFMTGKLVSACMLNKLRGRIEAYPEDGGTIISGTWK